jgi:hypothetical protein
VILYSVVAVTGPLRSLGPPPRPNDRDGFLRHVDQVLYVRIKGYGIWEDHDARYTLHFELNTAISYS